MLPVLVNKERVDHETHIIIQTCLIRKRDPSSAVTSSTRNESYRDHTQKLFLFRMIIRMLTQEAYFILFYFLIAWGAND